MDIVKLLREQAAEIAAEGHLGWGNTMLEAAREIEFLQSQAAQHSVHPTRGSVAQKGKSKSKKVAKPARG